MSSYSGSALVLGGPGTGKTHALVEAVVDRVRVSGRPLVLARTRRNEHHIRLMVAAHLSDGVLPPILTFHAFALAIVREFGRSEGLASPRIVDAASQERRLREILRGSMLEGTVTWPARLAAAVSTDGFAAQLRLALSKADKSGISPDALVQHATDSDRDFWEAFSAFAAEYQDVLDAEGVIDYSDVVARAVGLLEDSEVREVLQGRYGAIFVDECEDVDASQRALLHAVRAPDACLQLFADPDQSVESFRGGSFAGFDSLPTVVLRRQYRFGKGIGNVVREVLGGAGLQGLPRDARQTYRRHEFGASQDSQVRLLSFDNSHAQAEAIVDRVRRAKMTGEVKRYAEIAVIARGAHNDLSLIQNALRAAGIPSDRPGASVPILQSNRVQVVVEALSLALADAQLELTQVARLLTAPAFNIDPLAMRKMSRQLRRGEGSPVLDALRGGIERLREQVTTGSIAEVVWSACEILGYPIESEGIVDLLDLAVSHDEASAGRAGVRSFLDDLIGQRLAPRRRSPGGAPVTDAVALTTAHESRGSEWQVVFLCDLQEGRWPQLGQTGSLFDPRRTVKAGVDEERRLFYVACTRARRKLILTSVSGNGDGRNEPSRFFSEVAGRSDTHVTHHAGYHCAPLTTAGVVASLRRAVADPSSSHALQQAARQRLAKLAAQGVASAREDQWWGTRDWTTNEQPVRDADAPIRISGSSWEALDACSLRWFFEHEVNARTPSGPATNFGTIIHAVADSVARGDDRSDEQILEALSEAWPSLGYEATWLAQREFSEAVQAIRRFRQWHESRPNRRMVATEVRFDQELSVPGDTVRATGVIDRLEVDEEAGMFVIDLKTKRKAETKARVAEHRQLSLYQAVVAQGELNQGREVAGAELVQLRIDDGVRILPKVQSQAPVDVTDVRERLGQAAALIRNEEFRPSPSALNCRVCPFTQVCPAYLTTEG